MQGIVNNPVVERSCAALEFMMNQYETYSMLFVIE